MTDYNDREWHRWPGHDHLPEGVHPRAVLMVSYFSKSGGYPYNEPLAAKHVEDWSQVIAFKVCKVPEPREWWINRYSAAPSAIYSTKEFADKGAGDDRLECVRVREVLDDDVL